MRQHRGVYPATARALTTEEMMATMHSAERDLQGTESKPAAPATRNRVGFELLLAAAVLGALGNALLREVPWGVNVPLWVVGLLATLGLAARRWRIELRGEGVWMLLPALFFAAAIAWRASSVLLVLNTLALIAVLALGAFRARGGRLRTASVGEYIRALFLGALNAVAGCLFLLVGEVQWRGAPLLNQKGPGAAVLRGALIAVLPLFVFGVLFAAADPVFDRWVGALFRWQLEDLGPTLFWVTFWTWLSAGYLRQVLFGVPGEAPARAGRGELVLGATEVATVLGLLNVLFFAFVLAQFRYLFGGETLIEATAGLSYAEYARRGFFELVTVAALVLPLLLGLRALLGSTDDRGERFFRRFAAVLITLLFIIMASAAERMRMYQSEYGLTELRFYTTASMVWLAVVFVWFAATVLQGHRERFAWGALVAGLATLAVLNASNPDAQIVRINTGAARTNPRFDPHYLTQLSADAVPALLAALPALPPGDRCLIAARALGYRTERSGEDWRTWNWGRQRARRAVGARLNSWRAVPCPGPVRR